jgi:uncharacterized protein YbbK (DUF523 family)
MKFLISACLTNQPVRYDGKGYFHQKIADLLLHHDVITACPEILGGLKTPRLAAEIQQGFTAEDVLNEQAQVVDTQGNYVTNEFLNGAYKTLEIAKNNAVDLVVLKENSPSCGSHFIYDGSFLGQKIEGLGITSTLLIQHGFRVMSEDDFFKYLENI